MHVFRLQQNQMPALSNVIPPTAIVIPSRIGSTRLKKKAMAFIGKEPMIVHVWRMACRQNIGPVIVACDDPSIAECIANVGGHYILTDPELTTGSDRVAQAISLWDPERSYDYVINVQGDLPYFSVDLSLLIKPLVKNPNLDMTTFIQPFDAVYRQDMPQVVKVLWDEPSGICKNFTRQCLETDVYHIGLYAFSRKALDRFAQLPMSYREVTEKLEQLRALDAGFNIGGVLLNQETFISVDTQNDLDHARAFLKEHQAETISL